PDAPSVARPEMRIAAVATVIGLIVFGIIAVYTFVSNAGRRPAPTLRQTEKAASSSDNSASIFVPTPQAAQDYQPPAAETAKSDTPMPDKAATDKSKPDASKTGSPERPAVALPNAGADVKQQQPAPAPAHKAGAQPAPTSQGPAPAPPLHGT